MSEHIETVGVTMAEGGLIEQEERQSLTIGSEFVFDFYCELCRDDGLNVEAEGFCEECEEYLCKTCAGVHKKTRPTRYHVVLDRDSMPKDIPLSQDRISKDISTRCKLHSKKTVKFYCASHDTLGCSTCFVKGHRQCTDIKSVYDKSENILDSLEYKDLVKRLKDMERKSRDMILKTRENVTTTEQNYSKTLDKIRKVREEVMTHFDELEQALIIAVETLTSEGKAKMEELAQKLILFSEEVNTLNTKVEALTNSKRVCQLFIQIQTMQSEMSNFDDAMRKMEGEIDARMFKFEPNNEIRNVITATGLGKIVEDTRDITAEHVSDIDTISVGDSAAHYMIGSAVMSNTKLVITDLNNKKVKLLDTGTTKLISEIRVLDSLFDVAFINEKQVAICLYNYKKIIFLNVTEKLAIDRELVVQGVCRGVAYTQNKLLVTFHDNPRLEVMDMQGNVIKTIDKNTNGSKLFSEPRHICVSKSGEKVYVSDEKANKVVCLSLDGAVKAVYTGLSGPQKVCTDHRGYIYVAGSDSKTVHMLTADCTKIKEILTSADGLDKRVLSVSHCPRTDRLYVGMDGSKMIKVYQLKST